MTREVIDWNSRLNSLWYLLMRRVSGCGRSDRLFRVEISPYSQYALPAA